ncbi:TPA: hypothetical protein I8Y00_004748 [Citrobacter farmeri]|uniref:Uncharacterized protein n=2 Tax=Citrobacter farmeri TaxID=67824 RepID=A0ACA8D2Z5_9ENTR|nr:STY0301 family protein [Citrobacter farmeri]AST78595.1 hypothetical protein CI104_05590 [Citrobacter farmeri]RSB13999.1 hypothetical protein EGK65_23790 [Citrobacter farmeri]HAT1588348.1 hypothetical protein [Citrobacter farmeri]
MLIRFLFPLLPCLVLLYSQCVEAWEVTCPSFINITASKVALESVVPVPWQVSSRYEPRLWLDGIVLTQDKPEKRGDLKPETKKLKGKEWQVWDTTFNTGKESDKYWISCVYNSGQAWLSQPVPVSSKSCRAPYLKEPPREKAVSMVCE